MKPDYTEYLDNNFARTELDWLANPVLHDVQFKAVQKAITSIYNVDSVVEFGCATGHLASRLPERIRYCGVDKSKIALEIAKLRRPKGKFEQHDFRTLGITGFDLSICFAVLKHFSLEEWESIAKKIIKAGRYSIIDIPVAEKDLDDGIDFPHVWKSEASLNQFFNSISSEILEIDKSTCEWIYLLKN